MSGGLFSKAFRKTKNRKKLTRTTTVGAVIGKLSLGMKSRRADPSPSLVGLAGKGAERAENDGPSRAGPAHSDVVEG